MAAVGKLVAKSAIATIRRGARRRLSSYADDARLESRQLGPVTSVQGQLNNGPLFDRGTQRGACRVDRGRNLTHGNRLVQLPDFQAKVQSVFSTYGEGDSFLHQGQKGITLTVGAEHALNFGLKEIGRAHV